MYTEYTGILDKNFDSDLFKRTILNINQLVTRQCKVYVSALGEAISTEATPKVVLRVETDDGTISCFMVEDTEMVQGRRPYDERAIEKHCSFTESSVRFQGPTPYSPCELVVAATKFLHYKQLPSDLKMGFHQNRVVPPFCHCFSQNPKWNLSLTGCELLKIAQDPQQSKFILKTEFTSA